MQHQLHPTDRFGRWWPGAYLAPAHLHPSWWLLVVTLLNGRHWRASGVVIATRYVVTNAPRLFKLSHMAFTFHIFICIYIVKIIAKNHIFVTQDFHKETKPSYHSLCVAKSGEFSTQKVLTMRKEFSWGFVDMIFLSSSFVLSPSYIVWWRIWCVYLGVWLNTESWTTSIL